MSKQTYDVFLSHAVDDKPLVERLALRLRDAGVKPWLDKWNLVPGQAWQPEIEKALSECCTCAVFFGPRSSGHWHLEEMRTAINRRVTSTNDSFRVIPVLLPGAERDESVPPFLAATTWVEFNGNIDDEYAFHSLVCGIKGIQPGSESIHDFEGKAEPEVESGVARRSDPRETRWKWWIATGKRGTIPNQHRPKPTWKYALAVVILLSIAVAIYAFSSKKTPLILLGSSNVHSYLEEKMSSSSVWNDIGPIWFDLASEDTQTTAYVAFDNGASISRRDVGFIAMSSEGSTRLAERFAEAKGKEKTDGKVFLSIVVARRPLAIFYRISSGRVLSTLNVQYADALPPELDGRPSRYRFMHLMNLKGIIDNPEVTKDVIPYLTTGNSGTKRLFAQAAKDDWPDLKDWAQFKNHHSVPHDIEGLVDPSFIEILSEPQRSLDRSGTCASFKKNRIEAAVICTGSRDPGTCEHVVLAEYVLIFKLQPAEEEDDRPKIANATECRFAREIDQRYLDKHKGARDPLTEDCRISAYVKPDPDGHIYSVDLDNKELPEYLSCGNSER